MNLRTTRYFFAYLYFATLGMPLQANTQEHLAVAAAPSKSASTLRQKIFGICELFFATEDKRAEVDDSSVNSLHPATYMDNFLPAEMQNLLNSRGSGGIDWDWYSQWSNSLAVTILRKPEHGKFVNLRNDPKLHSLQYLPDRDYVGKDRVDVLVEGKDDSGRPIALTIKYFINVLPSNELHRIVKKGNASIVQAQKRMCGISKGVWNIAAH